MFCCEMRLMCCVPQSAVSLTEVLPLGAGAAVHDCAWRLRCLCPERSCRDCFCALQDIAAKMAEVLRPYSKGSRAGLDARDRLHRILKQLQPIATAAPLQPGGS